MLTLGSVRQSWSTRSQVISGSFRVSRCMGEGLNLEGERRLLGDSYSTPAWAPHPSSALRLKARQVEGLAQSYKASLAYFHVW